MNKKDTDIHKPDGIFSKGEHIGHSDKESQIRKRDGILFRGDNIGYVDSGGKIRRPDGLISTGNEVGQVKGNKAHNKDGFIFSGEEWGYVDDDGNICQKDGLILKGRIVGKMRGKNKASALGYFVLRFKEMEDKFQELEQSVRSAENKTHYLGKIQHMLSYIPEANALGDFDGLIERLRKLEKEVLSQFDDNRKRKETIVRSAESLSQSTEWKTTAEELKKLQEQWKEIRSAGKDHEELLWQRFRSAQDKFYQHRSDHFDKAKRERENNLHRKEQLCTQAESAASNNDTKSAKVLIKELQAAWKTIGPVPKEQTEILWNRFCQACDQVFQNAREAHEQKQAEWHRRQEEYERKQAEWKSKMRDTLYRKREQAEKLEASIAHDESNIERWNDTIYNLHEGGRADEIRDSLESKISDVKSRINSKQDSLSDLKDTIRDIEGKLYK